ncbi:hypothetical protein AAMO2058_000713900 [Amorphochlora amoebiformis]
MSKGNLCSLKEMPGGVIAGWLQKKCPRIYVGQTVWQDRFCVFQPAGTRNGAVVDSAFSYWNSRNTKKPASGTLVCKRMEVVAAQPSEGRGRFSILMEGNRVFRFEADSDETALKWVKAIREARSSERKSHTETVEIENNVDSTCKLTRSCNAISVEGPNERPKELKYWKKKSLNQLMSLDTSSLRLKKKNHSWCCSPCIFSSRYMKAFLHIAYCSCCCRDYPDDSDHSTIVD